MQIKIGGQDSNYRKLVRWTGFAAVAAILIVGAVSIVMSMRTNAANTEIEWESLSVGETVTVDNADLRYAASNYDGTRLITADGSDNLITTTNAGQDWDQLKIQSNTSVNLRGLASSGSGTNLAAITPSDVYTSDDSGETWVKRVLPTNATWESIAISQDGTSLVVASRLMYGSSSLITSSDFGETWSERTNAGMHQWSAVDISADGQEIVAVTGTGDVHASDNHGEDWSVIHSEPGATLRSVAISADGAKIVAADIEGAVYTSSGTGDDWTMHEDAFVGYGYDPHTTISDDGTVIAVVSNGTTAAISRNGGSDWVTIADWLSNSFKSAAVSGDGDTIFIATAAGSVHVSHNQGIDWDATELTTEERSYPYWTTMSANGSGSKLIAAGGDGYYGFNARVSTDGGENWIVDQNLSDMTPIATTQDNSGDTILAVSSSGLVYVSSNGGETWSERTEVELPTGRASATMDASGTKMAIAAMGDYSTSGNIYVSSDGGETWSERTEDADIWVNVDYTSDGSKLYASSGYTVLVSEDDGATWSDIRPVQHMAQWGGISTNHDGSKIVATSMVELIDGQMSYGGVYISTDGGLNWSKKDAPATDAYSTPTYSRNGSKIVVAATYINLETSTMGRTTTYISHDDGETWSEIPIRIDGDMKTTIFTEDGSKIFIAPIGASGPIVMGVVSSSTPDPDPDPTPTTSITTNEGALTSTNPSSPQKLENKRPTFSGQAAPFSTVVVTVNSDPIVCTTTADTSGNWSCTLPSDIPAGVHTVTVVVTDPDTNDTESFGPFYIQAGETIDDETPIGGGSGSGGNNPNTPNTGAEKRVTTNPIVLTTLVVLSVLSLAAVVKFRKQ